MTQGNGQHGRRAGGLGAPATTAQQYVAVNVYRVNGGFRVALMVKETNGRLIRLVRPAQIYPLDGGTYSLAGAAVAAAQALLQEYGNGQTDVGPA